MKRRSKIALAVGLAAALALPGVFAEEDDTQKLNKSNNGEGVNVTINLSIEPSFKLNIPDGIILPGADQTTTENYSVSVTEIVLPANHKLTVSVASKNGFYVIDEPKNEQEPDVFKLQYTMESQRGGKSFTYLNGTGAQELFTVEANDVPWNQMVSSRLAFTLDQDCRFPGEFSDTLTFTAVTENLNTQPAPVPGA